MPVPQLFKGSPRPDQPDQPHQPDQTPAVDASPALPSNVRSMTNGSSVYSQSPNPNSNTTTPKIPFLGRFRREQPPSPLVIPNGNDPPRDSQDSRSPLQAHRPHTAGSYVRTIAPLQDSREAQTVYNGEQQALDRHPADVPLDYSGNGAPDAQPGETTEEINERRRRRRRHRRRRDEPRDDAWIRRRNGGRGTCLQNVRGAAARGKLMASAISGTFLVTVLAIYLALALSRSNLGQEVHVLFIMIVLGTTIFFCHSLIRLCMLIIHPPLYDEATHPSIPNMSGPEGFRPIRPIQVHLARDEDLDDYDAERADDGSAPTTNDGENEAIREKALAPPPPAYGLWRSSVRVDPNLLHWQRVENQALPGGAASRSTSALSATSGRSRNLSVMSASPVANSTRSSASSHGTAATDASGLDQRSGPRPPSYASEDGVSYIVEAAPRSVAPSPTGLADVHPAWRPGLEVGEVPMDEWPRRDDEADVVGGR
ncbi:hypothetical protein P280DRAFT_80886 [Massarina eburnea CBS 473.64]|uniref:Uncharacterized protein n=1 Tax=Massarina eburnea CBS 473.64 TaxID=1395130 RepID=A0A6A6RTH2_9PLEO|nr:hypothetical protein P280DRAFT_80886 [Massarina eburnea CBS 473.64]